ncbi:MAG TPA: hypothetical protein VMR41_01115 [Patescibacteria group bacterium]|nr:hypothetical protein [Patescibacteria group bacterium]
MANAVLYLTKSFFDFYAEGMANSLRLTFLPNVVDHLDVISSDNFLTQIEGFIKDNHLPAANVVIIVADDLLFCKEIPPNTTINNGETAETKEFLDLVPFDSVLSKLYKLEKKQILVAMNADFFKKFQHGFKENGSRIESVIPQFLLGNSVNLSNGMPIEAARAIIDKLGNIRPWSMPVQQEIDVPVITQTVLNNSQPQDNTEDSASDIHIKPKKSTNSKTIIMGVCLLPLFGIFIFMFLQMNAENSKQEAAYHAAIKTNGNPTPVVVQPTTSNSPTESLPFNESGPGSAFAATIDEQNLKVSVEYSTASAALEPNIKDVLNKFGIQSIKDVPTPQSNSATSEVMFADSIPVGTRQRIVSELQKVIPNISEQDNSGLSEDVLIILP